MWIRSVRVQISSSTLGVKMSLDKVIFAILALFWYYFAVHSWRDGDLDWTLCAAGCCFVFCSLFFKSFTD